MRITLMSMPYTYCHIALLLALTCFNGCANTADRPATGAGVR